MTDQAVVGTCPHCGKECDESDPLATHVVDTHGGARTLRENVPLLVGVLLLFLLVAVSIDHRPAPTRAGFGATPTTAAVQVATSSPAYLLASLNYGSPSIEQVAHFKFGLDQLADRCTNTRQDLADIIVATRNFLQRRGRPASYEAVMDGLVAGIPSTWGRDCGEPAAAWAAVYLRG
jgi:hypothetical protein